MKIPSRVKSHGIALMLLAATPLAFAQVVTTITFDNESDLLNNFRPIQAPGGGTATVATDSTPNGYVNVLAGGTGIPAAYVSIYDTTPGNGGDPNPAFSGAFTLSLDISSANPGTANSASFGIYLFESGNSGNNLLALFTIDSNAVANGNEQIRFWRDGTVSTGAVGTQYTVASGFFTGTGGANDTTTNSYVTTAANRTAVAIDSTDPFTFYPITFAYDPVALTLKVSGPGGFSSTLAIPVGDVITNPSIALRVSDPQGTDTASAKFDNFSVVPEPSTGILMLAGASLLALRRQRP